jgi:hypothetical protein
MRHSISKKTGYKVREYDKERRETQKLDTINSRSVRHRVSAVHRRNRLGIVTYFYVNDWRTYAHYNSISPTELTHSLTIIFISAAAFGTGIGLLLQQFFGGR